MLVLSRKVGESIVIGDNIRVTIVDVGQGRVKIGIVAPNNVSIDREEIYDKKQLEKEYAGIDAEDAVPVNPLLHNRIAQLADPTQLTPAPTPKGRGLDFRSKSR